MKSYIQRLQEKNRLERKSMIYNKIRSYSWVLLGCDLFLLLLINYYHYSLSNNQTILIFAGILFWGLAVLFSLFYNITLDEKLADLKKENATRKRLSPDAD